MGLIKGNQAPANVVRYPLRDIEAEAEALRQRAREEAETIIAQARERAEDIEVEARERGSDEGWRQGYEDGRALGRQDALAQAADELQQVVGSLKSAASSLGDLRGEVEAVATADAVRLAIAIAERVTKRLGVIDPKVLVENLREAMKLVVRGGPLRVAVHGSQTQTLAQVLPHVAADWPALLNAEIIADDAVAPGGCRVFTAQGHVDADLQTQLDRITAKLLPHGGNVGGGGAA